MRKLGKFIAGAAFTLAAMPAAAQNLPLQAAKDGAAQVGRYFSQSRACKWANDYAGNSQGSFYGYLYGAVLAEQGKAVADTVLMGSPPAAACGSAEDKAAQTMAAQITFEWLTRLAMAQGANAQPDWRKDMLALPAEAANAETYRISLETQFSAAMGAPQLKAWYEQIAGETNNDFALACNARKDNGKTTRACPALPADAGKLVPLANARVKAIEDLAFKLARDHRDALLGAHGSAYRAFNPTNGGDRFAPCKAGDLVVYPAAPDTQKSGANSEVTLRRFQQPGSAGRVTLKEAGGGTGYAVVDSSKAPNVAELKSSLYAIEFHMCRN
jgi:hypothetical protein